MTIVVDMNLSRLWCPFLATAGFTMMHWSEIGRADTSDDRIMTYASDHGYVVFTEDLDFGILLARNRLTGPSVLQIRTKMNLPRQIGHRVLEALDRYGLMLEEGGLVSVDAKSIRGRALPLC